MKELIKKCPKCDENLLITEYSCPSCDLVIKGEFNIAGTVEEESHSVFEKLSEEDRYFILVFLQTGGVIQDVEKIMGISYPTVKAKLKDIQNKLSGASRDWNPMDYDDVFFEREELKNEIRQMKKQIRDQVRNHIHSSMRRGMGINIRFSDDDSHGKRHSQKDAMHGESFTKPEPDVEKHEKQGEDIKSILDKLESGEINPETAIGEIGKINKG